MAYTRRRLRTRRSNNGFMYILLLYCNRVHAYACVIIYNTLQHNNASIYTYMLYVLQ